MFGIGSSTFYKMVVKSDGSPNWPGIIILFITFLVVFVWRCLVFIPEYWVGVRLRFNRVVRDKDNTPIEYDPLQRKSGKNTRGIRFRFYLLNSIRMVNCGDRETNLDIDSVTINDYDFDTKIIVVWNVSREPGCPSKSFMRPAESSWKWRQSKDELESLVRTRVADAVLRVYSERENDSLDEPGPVRLPILATDDIRKAIESLLENYGVNVSELQYSKRSVSPARRDLEGRLAIAGSNEKVAMAHHDVASAIRSTVHVENPPSDGSTATQPSF